MTRTRRARAVRGTTVRALALLVAIPTSLVVLTSTAASHAGTEKSAATEVGVTPTEIHIAVIADVENPFAPNVLIGARDAVMGFAKYINASCADRNRCLAGRKLVVDFYDSGLDPTKARNGAIQACANDLAMVGTSAVFLNTVDDMRSCADHAGATTGIPDIPFVASTFVQQCSDQSFPIIPPTLHCNTKDSHPQTFDANVARGYYFTKKYGSVHGVYVFTSDTTAYDDQIAGGFGALRDLGGRGRGIHSDRDFRIPPATLQSGYTPIIQAMSGSNSNYAQCAEQYSCTVSLRKEARLQGIADQVKVWDCSSQCYDRNFLNAGAVVDDEYVDTLFLPFYDRREQRADPMLEHFVHSTGEDKVDGIGVYAWGAAVAFRDAVNATVKAYGINGLTRVNLFAALDNIHAFNADGMLATIDLARRKTSDCHVLTQVRSGTFVRVEPTTPGAFDCNPKYVITRKLDLLTGQ